MPILLSQDGRFYNVPQDVMSKSEVKRDKLPPEVKRETQTGAAALNIKGRVSQPIPTAAAASNDKDVEGHWCNYVWWTDAWGNVWYRYMCY